MSFLKGIMTVGLVGLFLPLSAFATSGACSWHGGVDCDAGADFDGSVICNDGWTESSVSLLNSCEEELSLMRRIEAVAKSTCLGYIYNQNMSIDYGSCVSDISFSYYQAYDSSCQRGMLLSNNGSCFCLGYLSDGVCLSDVFVNDVYGDSCGGSLNVNTTLDLFGLAIEAGNPALDLFVQLSCNETIDSLSLALGEGAVKEADESATESSGDNSLNDLVAPGAYDPNKRSQSLINRMKGFILLQVEEHGEAWYVNPSDDTRYYMKDGATAYEMMRSFGLGITNADLNKLKTSATTDQLKEASNLCSSNSLANQLKGKILLQVEEHGEAYYVYPKNCRLIYMKDGSAAYEIMRYLGEGISNDDLTKMPMSNL